MIDDALAAGAFWGMAQHRSEIRPFLAWLIDTVGIPRAILEIGSHRGGTAALWCELGVRTVVSIDLPDGGWGGLADADARRRNEALSAKYPAFSGILADSHSDMTVAQMAGMQTAFDLLFLDGDHTHFGVKADFDAYRGFVRPGGVIAFHDIIDTKLHRDRGVTVSRFWSALPGEKVEFTCGAQWGGIGAVRA